MKNKMIRMIIGLSIILNIGLYADDNLNIESTQVKYIKDLDLLVFSQKVRGFAGKTTPIKNGQMNGAPVLAYVFPTTLKSTDVGFSKTEGIIALALTSHPDFDDTPLWDEDNDNNYANDGIIWHPHWVVLVKDTKVKGGLKVKQFKKANKDVLLPPTNPGMPMYMDSPGFSIVTKGNTIKALVPANRVNNKIDFKFDGVSALMKVNTTGKMPLLGVYKIYSVFQDKLDLKNSVKIK